MLLAPGGTHCDSLEWNNIILLDIVAQQERMLAGRSGQINILQHRAHLSDTLATDLKTRANARISRLATDNTALVATNQQQAAELDRLRGRTWAGKFWRKTRNLFAGIGLTSAVGITLKLVL